MLVSGVLWLKLGLLSHFFWGHELILVCYTHSDTKCHCMTLKFVCGVLCAQLGLLGLFFFLRPWIHTDILHTLWHHIFLHVQVRQNLCLLSKTLQLIKPLKMCVSVSTDPKACHLELYNTGRQVMALHFFIIHIVCNVTYRKLNFRYPVVALIKEVLYKPSIPTLLIILLYFETYNMFRP